MVDFMLWFLESSLLILFVLGIRKIFSGKISYRAIIMAQLSRQKSEIFIMN